MTYTIAPACRALLTQATLRYPNRDRSSDGLMASPKHRDQAPKSFHNPSLGDGIWTDGGVVLAVDLTHDPANGCDAHQLARDLVARNDKRVSEAISQGRIWTRKRAAEGWRPYRGSNPHDKHAHITVAWEHRNSTDPWWPRQEDDDMTPEQDARLKRIEAFLDALTAKRRPDKKDADPNRLSLADLYTQDERKHQ